MDLGPQRAVDWLMDFRMPARMKRAKPMFKSLDDRGLAFQFR